MNEYSRYWKPKQNSEQQNIDFDAAHFSPEDNFYPPSISRVFVPQARSRSDLILQYMQGLAEKAHKGEIPENESYKTKAQIVEMVFPDFYNPHNKRNNTRNSWFFDGTNYYNQRKMVMKDQKEQVGRAIREIDQRIREQLKTLKNPSEKLEFLRNRAQLLIRVGETDIGAAIYAYHGFDFPQSMELLQANLEWSIEHKEKQSAIYRTAEKLCNSATNSTQERKLNLDIPDDPENEVINNESDGNL
ncbi:MAG: hypothetical protein AB4290_10295 [Spirulina sp.]